MRWVKRAERPVLWRLSAIIGEGIGLWRGHRFVFADETHRVASLHRLRGQPARCPGLAVGLSQPGGLLAARYWLPGLEVRQC